MSSSKPKSKVKADLEPDHSKSSRSLSLAQTIRRSSLNLINTITGSSPNVEGSNLSGKKKLKKRVHFHGDSSSKSKLTTIHLIEPLFEYYEDLWWSKDEIELCRWEQAKFNEETNKCSSVKSYIHSYERARQQIYCQSRLSASLLNDLIIGRNQGFGGMERYSFNLFQNRKRHIEDTVASTLSVYESTKKLPPSQKLTKAHYQSLVGADRQWAAAMGKADAAAAASVYKETHNRQLAMSSLSSALDSCQRKKQAQKTTYASTAA